jgi:polyadenylate-binding protein
MTALVPKTPKKSRKHKRQKNRIIPNLTMAATSPYQSASLYVGDLNPTISEANLFDIFKAIGPVASIRVCRDAVTRRSLGYAYVNFHSVADAERALEILNYTLIKGRPCRIMWSHRDPSIRRSGQGNIFIKNLDKSIDNKTLCDTFSTFGNILSCKVVTDPKGNSKGYGFVHYETRESADQAIQKVHGKMLNGKIVYVGPFVSRKERSPGSDPEMFTNVYIKNLGENYSDEDLKRDFGVYGNIQSAILMKDPRDQARQFGFINYELHENAQKAVEELNGRKLGEREVYVGRAQKRAEREAYLRKLREERAQKYQGINLYVKNLDDSVNDEELEKMFSALGFGQITSSKVMTDDKGNTRGFGFVCYTNQEDANKAISEMNGKMVNNKPIYVSLAERKEVRTAKLASQHAARMAAARVGNPGLAATPMGYPGFYPQAGPQRVLAAQGSFVGYPQGVPMPRRAWNGPQAAAPHAQGRQYQPIPPGYNVMQPVPGGRQPLRQSRPPATNGAPQSGAGSSQQAGAAGSAAQQTPNGAAAAGRFKYTPNARNQMQAVQSPTKTSEAIPALPSLPSLNSVPPEEATALLGESLYPLVEALTSPAQGPKITGMLLESLEPNELLHLLHMPDTLKARVEEALTVLREHEAQAADAPTESA